MSTGGQSQSQIQADQSQVDSALSAINQIASNTNFGGQNLLDGSLSYQTKISIDRRRQAHQCLESNRRPCWKPSSNVVVAAKVVTASTQGTLNYNGGNLTSATTLQVSGAQGSQVLFFGAGSSYQNVADAVNANTAATGVSASITTAAVASTYTLTGAQGDGTIGSAGANNGISFQGNKNATVAFVVGGNNTAQSISVTGNAITVNLATDANGNVTAAETANAIATAINGNSQANALVTATSNAAGLGNGTGLVAAHGAQALTDNSDLTFTDARQDAGASDAAESVKFVVSGNSTARSVSVNGNAITVNLATDANGNVASTETASAIATFLNGNAQTSALITTAYAGDGAGKIASSSGAQSLTGGVNATLTLTSTDYGSQQFVGVSALNGSFGTFDSTNTASSPAVRGTDIVAQINGQTAQGDGLTATTSSSLLNASVTFAAASNASNVTSNVTITGGGALFQIGQNVSAAGQVGIGINAANTATLGGSAGKLYELGSGGGKSLLDVGQNGVTGGNLVDIVNQALAAVDTQRATIGSIQSNNIQTNINSLGVALSNISGAKSQISDTDFAATTAQLTQSQVLTQAGISVLQIANQEPQQVLKLLG